MREDNEIYPLRRRLIASRRDGDNLILKRRLPRKVFRLNQTGEIVWSRCDGQTSVASMLETLEARYKDASGSMRRDVMAILTQLKSHGMLTFHRKPRNRRRTRRIDLRSIPFYVIVRKSDVFKRDRMQQQLSDLGLRFELVDAMECVPPTVGTAISHLRILCREDIETPFAVLEDDCVFSEYFRYEFTVPADTDAFYLGISRFGIAVPGELSWGKINRVKWIQYDHANLRVFNMLALHAMLYLRDRFRRAATKAMIDALVHPGYMYPCDVGLASTHFSHLVLTPTVPICYQSAELGGKELSTRKPLTER